VIYARLLKNAQMQGPEILCRERFQTIPYDVRRNKPAPGFDTGKDKETPQMGVFQQPAKTLPLPGHRHNQYSSRFPRLV
jgi:hypothetical protein